MGLTPGDSDLTGLKETSIIFLKTSLNYSNEQSGLRAAGWGKISFNILDLSLFSDSNLRSKFLGPDLDTEKGGEIPCRRHEYTGHWKIYITDRKSSLEVLLV